MDDLRPTPRVVVVGGGVSGLTAAYRLRQLLGPAARITVLERSERVGGKLRAVALAGRSFDVGAEAFLLRRPEAGMLLTELGLADEMAHPAPLPSTVLAGGRLIRLPGRTLYGVPAEAEAVRDVLSREALASVAAERDLAPVLLDGDDVSVGGLLRARFGDELTDRLVDPLLGGVYAGRADDLGLRATIPALAGALDAGAGTLLGAVRSLLPAPAGDRPPAPVFGALRGGYSHLVDRLVSRSAADIRPGVTVRAVRRTATGWLVESGPVPNPEFLHADAVVLATPPPAARGMLVDTAPAASAAYGRIDVASTVLVGLALPADTPLPQSCGVLIGVGERHADGTPFTAKAFTFSSRKWRHHAGDHLMVRASVGRFGETADLRMTDDQLRAAVLRDLTELTGSRCTAVDSTVTRWGGALPQYGVGHPDLVATIERSVAGQPGLAVAGAALHGVGVPACIATATDAARRIAEHLGELPAPAEAR